MKQASLAGKIIFTRMDLKNEKKIELAFLTCLGRKPNAEESKLVNGFFNESLKGEFTAKAMEGLVHSLFACLDFRYLN